MTLDDQPYDALTRLYTYDPRLAALIDGWLDVLEVDPYGPGTRRHQFSGPTGTFWAITIPMYDGADYAIVWHMDNRSVVVKYIGPALFA